MSELNTLMDKDPLDLTDEDVDAIVGYLRENRKSFIAAEAAKAAGKKPKKASAPINTATLELDL